MPIYVDVSSAVHSKAGIGRYAESLAQALVACRPGQMALFYNRARRAKLPQALEGIPAFSVHAGYKPWRMAVWVGHLAGLHFNRLLPGAQLFHATEHLLPPLAGVPTVLTVHDMIFRLFPQHQKRLNYWYLNATMPLYCRRANAIITVSQSSKRDLVAHYGLKPEAISVIYEAAAPEFVPLPATTTQAIRAKYRLPEKYLLHVGTIEPRKNLIRLVEALHHLRSRGYTIPLAAVGGKGWLNSSLFRRVEDLSMQEQIHILGYVPGDQLPALYGAATALAMPSVYEGFGLPILEAMACGTPVISSNASSLPEIAGTAARYIDPYDVGEMAEAILTVWNDRELQERMRQQGRLQASKYSWLSAAQQTLEVYDRLIR